MSKTEHQYGESAREYPLEVPPESRLKREVKQGKAIDATTEPETTSTQTPDPNVDSVGDTLSAADTAAGTTTTVTDSGATSTTTGTPSNTARTTRSGRTTSSGS